jgi:hypothetical protein
VLLGPLDLESVRWGQRPATLERDGKEQR